MNKNFGTDNIFSHITLLDEYILYEKETSINVKPMI